MLGGLRDEAGGLRRPNHEAPRHLEFITWLMESPGKVGDKGGIWSAWHFGKSSTYSEQCGGRGKETS